MGAEGTANGTKKPSWRPFWSNRGNGEVSQRITKSGEGADSLGIEALKKLPSWIVLREPHGEGDRKGRRAKQ